MATSSFTTQATAAQVAGKAIKYFFSKGEKKSLLGNQLLEIYLQRARSANVMLDFAGMLSASTKALKFVKSNSELTADLNAKAELHYLRGSAYERLGSMQADLARKTAAISGPSRDSDLANSLAMGESAINAGSSMKYAYIMKPEGFFVEKAAEYMKNASADYEQAGNAQVCLGNFGKAHDSYSMAAKMLDKAAVIEPYAQQRLEFDSKSQGLLKLAHGCMNRTLC